jgi:hypothetical protein
MQVLIHILLSASYSSNFLCYGYIFFILQVIVTFVRWMETWSIIKVATHCMNFIHLMTWLKGLISALIIIGMLKHRIAVFFCVCVHVHALPYATTRWYHKLSRKCADIILRYVHLA